MATFNPAAGTDDGYWSSLPAFSNGAVGFRLGDNGNQLSSFARFAGVTIDNGATIDSAKITLTDWWDESTAADVVSAISAHDAADPAAPTDETEAAGATRTTASVNWTFGSATAQVTDATHDTPSLVSVVQELVNSYNYAGGAHMVFFFDFVSVSAARQLVFNSYDDDPTKDAVLTVTFTPPGGGPATAVFYAHLQQQGIA